MQRKTYIKLMTAKVAELHETARIARENESRAIIARKLAEIDLEAARDALHSIHRAELARRS